VYLPDYALSELQQYQNVIWDKTKQSPDELREYALELFASILIVPNMLISTRSHLAAFQLCKDIDTDDVVYVALSIEFDYPFLTRDKPLAAGLRAKGFTNVLLLDELISL
jgi:predicted nucleic acid-binding protein